MGDDLDDFGDTSHNSLIDILGSWFRGTLKEEAIMLLLSSSSALPGLCVNPCFVRVRIHV